jgi:uncharacterized protein with HEPN domain
MSESALTEDLLDEMLEAALKIKKRCSGILSVDEFMSEEGQVVLDSICMQLIAIGEAVKKVDKLTDQALLVNYPEVNWRAVAAMRDILSHHYFDLNAETVYGVCEDEIENLITVLKNILENIRR